MGTPNGCNSMAASEFVTRNDLIGWYSEGLSVLFGINGVRNERSHLGLYFQNSRPIFQLWQVGIS